MAWTEEEIQAVWDKGHTNSSDYRKDMCGAWMKRDLYGQEDLTDLSEGWEIDHIDPNGGDDLDNLQAMQWENNRTKSDNYPNWECKVTSYRNDNVYV